MSAQSVWEPGDPLHSRSTYRDNFFSFRDEAERTETCSCPDAARWPGPINGRHVDERDDLGRFIEEWHEWNDGEPA